MFIIPFVVLGAAYPRLPPEVPVMHMFTGHVALVAPKSAFVVLRVPLMNAIHGTMAVVMLRHAGKFGDPERRLAYSRAFGTLLFAIGVKSVLEALALSLGCAGPSWMAAVLGIGTLLCVIGGVAVALWHGRKLALPWPELRLEPATKVKLLALFGAYLLIVATSVWQAHRVVLAVRDPTQSASRHPVAMCILGEASRST